MIKIRAGATLELPTDEVCRFLTDAICTSFSTFENMEVWRITRGKHGRFRVDLAPKAKPKPAISVVDRPKEAAR
jgi:hypothetical protein